MTELPVVLENAVTRTAYAQNQIEALHSLAYLLVSIKQGTNLTTIATEAASLPFRFDSSRAPTSLGLGTEAGRLIAAFLATKEPWTCGKDGCRQMLRGWEEVIVSKKLTFVYF